MIVENLPVPDDRRVWLEATTLRRAGYQVAVVSPMGPGATLSYEEIDGIHVYRHPLPPESSTALGYIREYVAALYWEFRLASRVKRERGFDIVHICNPPDLLFMVAWWHKVVSGAAVIYDHHDLAPELFEAKYAKRGLFYALLRLVERLSFRTADIVISTNESAASIARERGGVDPARSFVVRSGPDLREFIPGPADDTYKRGRANLVGYLGVMGEQDGVDYLLRIARKLSDRRGRDTHFVLMGNGPDLPRLRALTRDLQIEDIVEFAGWVKGAELVARLSTCDVCVSPDPKTAYSDKCTMNKILEYMALARPIVMFDLLEGRTSAGDAALYAPPNDEDAFVELLTQLLDAPWLGTEMGRVGRERIMSEFAWEHQAQRLLSAYAAAERTG